MMTMVRGSTTIKRLAQGDSLTAQLGSTIPLMQFDSEEGGAIRPNWEEEEVSGGEKFLPRVYPRVRSTLKTGWITNFVGDIKWYIDEVLITAETEGYELSTMEFAGSPIDCLIIKHNIMKDATADRLIKAVFTVETGGYKTEMTASIPVTKTIVSPTTFTGFLTPSDAGGISTQTPEISIKATLWKGGWKVEDTDFTTEWWIVSANDTDGTLDGLMKLQREINGVWTDITGNPITLRASDIHVSETIVCKFRYGGEVVATKAVVIVDNTDPYYMVFNFSPKSGIVSDTDDVTVTPKVMQNVKNSEGEIVTTEITSFKAYAFSLFNGSSFLREQKHTNINNKYFTVTYSDYFRTVDGETEVVDRLHLFVETRENWE